VPGAAVLDASVGGALRCAVAGLAEVPVGSVAMGTVYDAATGGTAAPGALLQSWAQCPAAGSRRALAGAADAAAADGRALRGLQAASPSPTPLPFGAAGFRVTLTVRISASSADEEATGLDTVASIAARAAAVQTRLSEGLEAGVAADTGVSSASPLFSFYTALSAKSEVPLSKMFPRAYAGALTLPVARDSARVVAGLDAGAIAGIVIGSFVGLALLAAAGCYVHYGQEAFLDSWASALRVASGKHDGGAAAAAASAAAAPAPPAVRAIGKEGVRAVLGRSARLPDAAAAPSAGAPAAPAAVTVTNPLLRRAAGEGAGAGGGGGGGAGLPGGRPPVLALRGAAAAAAAFSPRIQSIAAGGFRANPAAAAAATALPAGGAWALAGTPSSTARLEPPTPGLRAGDMSAFYSSSMGSATPATVASRAPLSPMTPWAGGGASRAPPATVDRGGGRLALNASPPLAFTAQPSKRTAR
jgi:hypothetical protein